MELYHVLNRGVEKRIIFEDDFDRARFVHDLYEFNDMRPADNDRRLAPMIELRSQSSEKRQQLVEIHAWCVMSNHYHLLLSEARENGITRFLRKLNIGYAMYFNERYDREGALFQGRTKKIKISTDGHFLHILNYIHLNPLDFLKGAREWRSGHISHRKQALAHLDAYRWSSYLDYCDKKNFPSVITNNLFDDRKRDYRLKLMKYLGDMESFPETLALE